jgi:hypothetical protein
MTELVSPTAFTWVLTALTGGLAGVWLIYDARNLVRVRREDRRDPRVRDKIFGYVMGIVIGALGVIGVLKHHL